MLVKKFFAAGLAVQLLPKRAQKEPKVERWKDSTLYNSSLKVSRQYPTSTF